MGFRWHALAFVSTSVGRVNIELKKKLKKTLPVARDVTSQAPPPPAAARLRWLLWAYVGLWWLLWGFVGFHWRVLAFAGTSVGRVSEIKKETIKKNIPRAQDVASRAPAATVAVVGRCWPVLAVVGLRCPSGLVVLPDAAAHNVACSWLLCAVVGLSAFGVWFGRVWLV